MNLLLFERHELTKDGGLSLTDRRFRHLVEVQNAAVGDSLRVGELDGLVGEARLTALDERVAHLQITLHDDPPAPMPLTVVLALTRPKMLRRILRTLAEVGVKEIHLINSYRVEKSFWQSPLLRPEAVREALRWGLEQGMDTRLPTVTLHRRFRPFAEDVLPGLCAGRPALLAHPGADTPYPATPTPPALVLVGPEGGFIAFERELITAAGALPVSLGQRILRVETALFGILGRHVVAAGE